MFGNKKYLPYLLVLLVILVIIYFSLPTKSTTDTTLEENNGKNGNNRKKESFVSITWSPQTIKNFLSFEQTTNPNLIFDVDVIQQQATEDEVKILLKTGKWPWDTETKKLYIDAVTNNTILKISPEASMEQARTIYNQTIIREMLSWNAPEGQFLLRGAYAINTNANNDNNDGSGTYGINSGLITKNNNLIRCGVDKNNPDKAVLQEILNQGNDGITGAHQHVTLNLDYNKLPTLVQGFRFLNSPCDPCVALNSPPNYTCPFSLTSKDPSPIWQSLWGIQSSNNANINDINSNGSNNINGNSNNKTRFPLLTELQNELNDLFPNTGITTAASNPTPAVASTITSNATESTPAATASVSSPNQQNVSNAFSRLTTSLANVLNKPNVASALSNSMHSFADLLENP